MQLWLPCLGRSLNFPEVSRDAQRAFELWQGEPVVWMLPEIRTPARWSSRGIRNLAVPSEEIDKIDVLHVSDTSCASSAEAGSSELDRLNWA